MSDIFIPCMDNAQATVKTVFGVLRALPCGVASLPAPSCFLQWAPPDADASGDDDDEDHRNPQSFHNEGVATMGILGALSICSNEANETRRKISGAL